jgi:hypothetical protein
MIDDVTPSATSMPPVRQPRLGASQFSLGSLFEYTAWCAVLSGCASFIGLPASGFLMAMGLALVAGQGMWALVMLMAASIFTDNEGGFFGTKAEVGPFGRQFIVIGLAILLCVWQRWRNKRWEAKQSGPPKNESA